jgi:surfactin synthase thioesterase subunit
MTANRWLLRIPAGTSAGRIFCFPYSGVGASMFSQWPQWIGEFEVCPIQLPGRENRVRDPHYGTYPELAEILAGELRPFLDRPFLFFGHCAGALPAFETARLLDELPTARRLVVSAQVAPHHCPHDRFLSYDDERLVDELRQLVLARGGQPHPALLAMSLAVLRDDLDANRVYRLAEPVSISTDITVLHWSADTEVTMPQLGGWRHYARDVRFAELPGGHYEFLTAPPALLDLLAAALPAGVTP